MGAAVTLETKTPVLGLIGRKGKIKAFKVENVKRKTLHNRN